MREFLAETLFAGVHASGPGRACAIDIDGVLETDDLGFLALTPAAALALRALVLHGFRPLLVTGRSLEEVQDRCRAYGLAGGVAEYGAVIYDHGRATTAELLTQPAIGDLERVRSTLWQTPGVTLDERYTRGIRAFIKNTEFKRRSLEPGLAAEILDRSEAAGRVYAVQGESQTDFVAIGIDKAFGLRALLHQLGCEGVAMAIGDSVSDVPMLRLAERAFVPANADTSARKSGAEITRGAFQLGFVEAVTSVVGHAPGRCSICRAPDVPDRTRLLLTILSGQDHRGYARLTSMLELVSRTARLSVGSRIR
jgi:HAD superfamily hydrolase (TIGR01484 family)